MAVETAIIRQTHRGGAGDQSFTSAGFGTPQLAIFFYDFGITDGVPKSGVHSGFGATDGVNNVAMSEFAANGFGTSDTIRGLSITRCIYWGATSLSLSAYFKEWTTDGVTITFANETIGTNRLITCVLIKGLTNVDVHNIVLENQDIETHKNDLGFEPTDLIVFTSAKDSPDRAADLINSLGFVHNGNSVSQVSMCKYNEDNVGITDVGCQVRDDCGAMQYFNQTLNWKAEFTDFDVDGYSVYPRDGNSGDILGVIALQHDDSSWCGIVDSPTVTGNKEETGPGLTPEFVMMGLNGCSTVNTPVITDDAGPFGVSAFNSNGDEYCESSSSSSQTTSSHERGVSDNQAINLDLYDSGFIDMFDASFVSMDSDGFTLNYTTVDSTVRKWPVFAIGTGGEEPGGGGQAAPVVMLLGL